MRERIRAVLDQLSTTPEREAAWLNTLSLLEYIGARKISRTVAAHHPNLDVLTHWADETRHSAAFKRLSREVSGAEPDAYVCIEQAKTYFAELDSLLSSWLAQHSGEESPLLSYLLVTTVIERRAMVLYPLYRAASRDERVRDELSRVIIEEQSHRRAIEERCRTLLAAGGMSFEEPLAQEEALFERFLSAIENALGLSVANPVFAAAERPTANLRLLS